MDKPLNSGVEGKDGKLGITGDVTGAGIVLTNGDGLWQGINLDSRELEQ